MSILTRMTRITDNKLLLEYYSPIKISIPKHCRIFSKLIFYYPNLRDFFRIIFLILTSESLKSDWTSSIPSVHNIDFI